MGELIIADDLDGNSKKELIVGGWDGKITIYESNGDNSYSSVYSSPNLGGNVYGISTSDLYNTGQKQIIVTVNNGYTIKIFNCTGVGSYSVKDTLEISDFGFSSIAVDRLTFFQNQLIEKELKDK